MVAIPFPVSTYPGERPSEGAGRLINCRAEAIGEAGRATAVRHRVPGLDVWATSDEARFRGALEAGSTLYIAFDGVVKKLTADGGAVDDVDALDGSDVVYFAKNNKRPTADIVIVCSAGVFTLASDVIADLGDPDLPAPVAVCFLDGYFFFAIADGRCFASGLNATTINSNDFITTEAKADTLYRPVPWNGQLMLCGSRSIEVWAGAPVNDTGFPYSRVAVIQRGIVGPGAITGFEDGFGKALAFVGDDGAVHLLNGYTPTPISTPDLERLIEAADKATIEMSCHIAGGQGIIVVSCDDWCWEYSLATQKWNERKSYLSETWRGVRSFRAFDKWLCGDRNSGNILEITRSIKTEAGEPLIAEVWSAPVQKFPNRVRCARADFDFSTAVGVATGIDPNETDPSVDISHSDDGGYSFSNPRIRKLGRQGKPLTRVTLFNTGMTGAQGRIWRIRMSDPAHFGLMAGEMSAELKVA